MNPLLFMSLRHYTRPGADAAVAAEPASVRGGNGSVNKFSPIDAEARQNSARSPGGGADDHGDRGGTVSSAAAAAFAKAPLSRVVLGPDDMLYIPRGTWHYVRALTPSFSVNFWF